MAGQPFDHVNRAVRFEALRSTGYLDRDDALIVSNVFAEGERADAVSKFPLSRLRELIG
ncbi:hypothetical protein LG299_06420 [Microbacterium lacus]|uniref:hypothetical protein n=1 Tax=Microbacterium lacus TaxID=415217 RepID=UPI003850F56D